MFFFNDTATTEIYTLSLHDALPILLDRFGPDRAEVDRHALLHRLGEQLERLGQPHALAAALERHLHRLARERGAHRLDWKRTRLKSSHANISYVVFCLKKKKIIYLI